MAIVQQPLINERTYFAVMITIFTLTTATFLFRIVILYQRRTFHLNDCFLVLAFLCLTSGFGTYIPLVQIVYNFNAAISGEAPFPTNYVELTTRSAIFAIVCSSLPWASITLVKFSFLFAFRPLVQRQKKLETLWWCTAMLCFVVGATFMASPFILCPVVNGQQFALCTTKPSFVLKESAVTYYMVTADIITDSLLVSIPILLLRRTTLSTRQKLSIGTFLCLSSVMIAIALIRGISIRVRGTGDQTWSMFWVELECCIAVMMGSLSAFRQLFVTAAGDSARKRRWHLDAQVCVRNAWLNSHARLKAPWTKSSDLSDEIPHLPNFDVGATMTGMRTVIKDGGRTTLGSFGQEDYSAYVDASGVIAAERV